MVVLIQENNLSSTNCARLDSVLAVLLDGKTP